MTLFESIFAFISIVTSLALTHLIAGVVKLVRHAERSRVSWVHACWLWLAFVLVIGNWAGLIGVQDDPHWPPARIILWLTAMISLYAFSALVLPDPQPGDEVCPRDPLRRPPEHRQRRLAAAGEVRLQPPGELEVARFPLAEDGERPGRSRPPLDTRCRLREDRELGAEVG